MNTAEEIEEPKVQHPPISNAALNTALKPIDDEVILSLHKQGHSTYQIADYIGCNQSTVFRHLKKIIKQNKVVKVYKEQRADLLAFQQAEEYEIQAKLRDHLKVDSNILALSESQKKSWYDSLNISSGTKYDKERIERGLSTSNMSIAGVIETNIGRLDDVSATIAKITAELNSE